MIRCWGGAEKERSVSASAAGGWGVGPPRLELEETPHPAQGDGFPDPDPIRERRPEMKPLGGETAGPVGDDHFEKAPSPPPPSAAAHREDLPLPRHDPSGGCRSRGNDQA